MSSIDANVSSNVVMLISAGIIHLLVVTSLIVIFEGSVHGQLRKFVVGGLLRDHNGRVIFSFVLKVGFYFVLI